MDLTVVWVIAKHCGVSKPSLVIRTLGRKDTLGAGEKG